MLLHRASDKLSDESAACLMIAIQHGNGRELSHRGGRIVAGTGHRTAERFARAGRSPRP